MSVSLIEQKLAQLRGHIRLMFLSYGLAKLLMWAAGLTLWLFYSDRVLELPGPVRIGFLAVAVLILLVVVVRSLIYPLSRTLSDEDLALLVEREYPLLNDRLISSLQMLKDQERYKDVASAQMIQIVVGESFEIAGKLQFHEAVRSRRLAIVVLGSIFAMSLIFAHAVFDLDAMSTWVRRSLGAGPEWPTRTKLEVRILTADELPLFPTSEDLNLNFTFDPDLEVPELGLKGVFQVALDSDLRIIATPSGEIPDEAEIRIEVFRLKNGRYVPAGKPIIRKMTPVKIAGEDGDERVYFSYNKLSAQNVLERIYVKAGDARAKPLTLMVVPPPQLDGPMELAYRYPEYLVLPERKTQERMVEGVAGTEVQFEFSTTKPLLLEGPEASGLVVDYNVGSSQKFPLKQVDGGNHYRVKLNLALGMSRYRLRLADEKGIANSKRLGDLMLVREDVAPTVKVLFSGDPLVSNQLVAVTRDAVIPIEFEMDDDYGIGSAKLFWRFAEDETFRVYKPFSALFKDLRTSPQAHVATTFKLEIAKLVGDDRLPSVAQHPQIQVYIQAFDLNQIEGAEGPVLQGSRHNPYLNYEIYEANDLRAKVSTQIRQIKTIISSMLAMQRDLLAATATALENPKLLDLKGPEGERLRTDLNDGFQKQNQLLRDAEAVLQRFDVFAQVYQFCDLEKGDKEKPQESHIQHVRMLLAITAAERELQRELNNAMMKLDDDEADVVGLTQNVIKAIEPVLGRALPRATLSRQSFGMLLQDTGLYTPGCFERARSFHENILAGSIKPKARQDLMVALQAEQELSVDVLVAIQEQVKKWEGFDEILHGFTNLLNTQKEIGKELKDEARSERGE